MTPPFEDTEAFARQLDEADPASHFRSRFFIPTRADGQPLLYFCGNSLGLQPKTVPALLAQELDDWARLGVEGHFREEAPWYTYHELVRAALARLVGALPGEMVAMNSLTVNLHLMLTSFYRPKGRRNKIVMDAPPFPSDLYAVQSQLRLHGLDPADTLHLLEPRPGEHLLRKVDIEATLTGRGSEIALVLFNGVNYYTGQLFDLAWLAELAHRLGGMIGLDLAHAAGNVVLKLHDWQIDFAVWCSYKYLNAGPGAVAGCFVHERHGLDLSRPRLAGWWGNDPATRFRMHLQPEFVPRPGADGWQLSNPPILALAPLRASLALFDEAGMTALRERSVRMSAYLDFLLDQLPAGRCERITPRASEERGCQVSLLAHDRPRELFTALQERGVVCDFREPNVIRVAPVPLYNSFLEIWRLAQILSL